MSSAALTQRERDALCEVFSSLHVEREKRWRIKRINKQFFWARKKVLVRRFFRG